MALIAVAWCCVSAVALAQLAVSPPIRELTAKPGRLTVYELKVSWTGEDAAEVKSRVSDLALGMNGFPEVGQDLPRGASGWITLDPADFSLQPGETKSVKATLNPPGAANGGYYAMVQFMVAPIRPTNPAAGGIIAPGKAVGAALLITVPSGRATHKFGVEDIALTRGAGGGWMASAVAVNDGNMHAAIRGAAALLSSDGRVVARAELLSGQGYVLAGGKRRFEGRIASSVLMDGVYTLKVDLLTGRGIPLAGDAATITLLGEKVSPGEPTAEVLATIQATLPKYSMDKYRIHNELSPGGTKIDMIRLQNLSKSQVKLQAMSQWWDLDSDGNLRFGAVEPSHKRSAVDMIAVTPAEVTLEPGKSATVKIQTRLPKGASGEYYAAVTFLEADAQMPAEPRVVRWRSAVISVLAKGTADRKTEVGECRYEPTPDGGGKIFVEVRNIGNAISEISGKAVVYAGAQTLGQPISFAGDGVVLVPGSHGVYEVVWPAAMALAPGRYRCEVTVLLVGGTAGAQGDSTGSFEFVVKPPVKPSVGAGNTGSGGGR